MLYSDAHGAVIGVRRVLRLCFDYCMLFPRFDHLMVYIPPSILSKWIPGPGVFFNSVIKSVMSSVTFMFARQGHHQGWHVHPFLAMEQCCLDVCARCPK